MNNNNATDVIRMEHKNNTNENKNKTRNKKDRVCAMLKNRAGVKNTYFVNNTSEEKID